MAAHDQGINKEQGFLAHLVELRDRLLRIVIAVGLVFLVFVPFAQTLYDFLAEPLVARVPDGLIAIGVVTPFFIPFKLALLAAFVVALPYVLYQIWGFIAPGLYQHEKKLAIPILVSSTLLFYLGMAFVYFVVLPMVFTILPNFAPQSVDVKPDIKEYLDFVILMFMAFGLGFEMPVATVLLIASGMTTRENLAKKRPYVVVVAFIVGMFLTPPDVISQIMLAIPMWLLFELGLLASRVFEKQLTQARMARKKVDEAERKAEQAQNERAATSATAASVRDGADVEPPTGSDNSANSWDDAQYSFKETGPVQDSDEYRPMTDAEMEAELERLVQEENKMKERQAQTDTDKTDKSDAEPAESPQQMPDAPEDKKG